MKIRYLRAALILTLILGFAVTFKAQSKGDSDRGKKQLNDKGLKIKSRGTPNERVLDDCHLSQNVSQIYVAILVTFDSSGKVTDAKIAGGYNSCEALDDECLKIARKIKFTPEIKNGIPVTVVKPITYQISITRNSRY